MRIWTPMKLFYSALSPFVRKVLVLAFETGIEARIERAPVTVLPTSPNEAVAAGNPLIKVPALQLATGEWLYDSAVIAEYLDTLHDGAPLLPRSGAARWTALRRQAAADGVLDAAILMRYETVLRPEEKRWPEWLDAQRLKIRNTLASFEAEAATLADQLTIGEISIACALGYLDFRFPQEEWRSTCPALARFYAGFAERPSMQATRPPT
jgi:glutathione S-transferase